MMSHAEKIQPSDCDLYDEDSLSDIVNDADAADAAAVFDAVDATDAVDAAAVFDDIDDAYEDSYCVGAMPSEKKKGLEAVLMRFRHDSDYRQAEARPAEEQHEPYLGIEEGARDKGPCSVVLAVEKDFLPSNGRLYHRPVNKPLTKKIKSWIEAEKKMRLLCNYEIMTLSEKIKGTSNYFMGRPVDAPSMQDAAERKKKKLDRLGSQVDKSIGHLMENNEDLDSYMVAIIDMVKDHYIKKKEAYEKRVKFSKDLKDLKQVILGSEKYSDEYIEAVKTWLYADRKYLDSVKDLTYHQTCIELRENEFSEVKKIRDSAQTLIVRLSNVYSFSRVLSDHMGNILETYEAISKGVKNVRGMDQYFEKSQKTLLMYRDHINKMKDIMTEQIRMNLSEEGSRIYTESHKPRAGT
ncbi:hypothetical protein JXB31_04480 [Candidatus Woesearchaeota archaeon]|nr:hypothetical protein [Candidatus Woesearchaeota archaeon]